MKNKFFTALAGMASVLLLGAMTVQAADITLGGQFQPRYEVRHQSESTGGVNNEAIRMRSRLNASAKIDDNTSAFIQLQMVNQWGGGLGFTPSSANDTSSQVGMHQAYFDLKNFMGSSVDVRIGRQEIILDAHRIFGNTLWTQGGQSHDALRLTHSHDNMTLAYIYSKVNEGADVQDEQDTDVHAFWANMKGLVGDNSSTSFYLVHVNSSNPIAAGPPATFNDQWWTIGARQAGGFGDISYRGEFYYQNGTRHSATTGTNDINAYMAGLRVGYTASQVAMKPSITLWGDYLSGNDQTDADWGGFHTMFDTGHKFYGLNDLILSFGPGSSGLIDLAVKLAAKPMENLTIKADLHHMSLAEDDAFGNDEMGQLLDITVVHKCSANLKMIGGFSYFFGDDNFVSATNNYDNAALDKDQSWAYLWLILNF